MGKQKYGIIAGAKPEYTYEVAFTKETVLSAKSGRYVVFDTGNGYARACENDEAAISGYVEESLTTSSSVYDELPVAFNADQFVCELPYASGGSAQTSLSASTLLTLWSDIVDIYATGNIQYADVATGQGTLRIVGGDINIATLYTIAVSAKLLNVT